MVRIRNFFGRSLAIFVVTIAARTSIAVTVPSNINGTFEVPAGEVGVLIGTITLNNGVLDVDGQLQRQSSSQMITGTGQVLLNAPSASWTHICCAPTQSVIDTNIEVLGERGASIAPWYMTNRGTIAAVAGGSTADRFTISSNNVFFNEGVLEARTGGRLRLDNFRKGNLAAGSILRAHAGGTLEIMAIGGSFQQLSDFGTVENLGGSIELRNVDFWNESQTTTFTGGEWTLLSGSSIQGGTVNTAEGGRLLVGAFSSSTDTADLYSTTLQGNLHIRPSGRLRAQNVTLDQGNIRFTGGAGYVVLPSFAPLAGTGTIVADGGVNTSGVLQASGGVVTIPETIALRADSGNLVLHYASGDTTGVFDIAGPMEAGGGTISHLRAITTRGEVVAHSGGMIDVNQTWNNLGSMRIRDDGRLDLSGQVVNEGAIEIRNSVVYLNGNGSIAGSGTVSIADSTVLAKGSTTLSKLMAIQGDRVDRGLAEGYVNLEGGTIELGSQPGQRWVFSGGTLNGGVVNSLDGAELITSNTFGKARLLLSNIELNADARVTTNTELTVQSTFSGTGRLIVDGGRITVGSFGVANMSPEIFDRIVPISGTVVLSGGINNVGDTIELGAGVSWRVSHGRNDGIVGGRIEGDPGAVLHVDSGYGSGSYATFRQNVTLAVPLVIISSYANAAYVREGLTLDHTSVTIGSFANTQPSSARLHFQGPQVLAGVGEVRFMPAVGTAGNPSLPQANMIQVDATPAGTFGLTIEEGILIRTGEGDGQVGGNYYSLLQPQAVALANRGTFLAENGHTLSLFVSELEQLGTLRAEADSTLVINSKPTAPQTAFVNAGRLEAAGGLLRVEGNFALAASSMMKIDWAANLAGDQAPIAVTGTAELGGALELVLDAGINPVAGDSMAILTATGGITGDFAQRWLPRLDIGLYWNLVIDADTAWLHVLAGAPEGDYNSDGVVDVADYTVWRDTDGTAQGYATWQANFGASTIGATGLGTTVPEPSTLLLLFWAASTIGTMRRQRRWARR